MEKIKIQNTKFNILIMGANSYVAKVFIKRYANDFNFYLIEHKKNYQMKSKKKLNGLELSNNY